MERWAVPATPDSEVKLHFITRRVCEENKEFKGYFVFFEPVEVKVLLWSDCALHTSHAGLKSPRMLGF